MNDNIEVLDDNNQQSINNQEPIVNNQPVNNNNKKHTVIVIIVALIIAVACTGTIILLNNNTKTKEVKKSKEKTDTIVDDKYHKEYEVTYKIGKGYKANKYNDESKKFYNSYPDYEHRKSINMVINYYYSSDDDEFDSIKRDEESLKKVDGYKDIVLNDIKTKKIHGKKYKYRSLEYKFSSTDEKVYKYTYVYKVDVDRYLKVEYEGYKEPGEEEFDFLDISIKKGSK